MRRSERLRAIAAYGREAPILLDGDAEPLLEILRAGAQTWGIAVADAEPTEPARIVVLAVNGDGRRSAFLKAAGMLREREQKVTADAIRIVVIQSGRSRLAPQRLQRLLATEILFQATTALLPAEKGRRSLREQIGLTTLEAAGLRIVRFA